MTRRGTSWNVGALRCADHWRWRPWLAAALLASVAGASPVAAAEGCDPGRIAALAAPALPRHDVVGARVDDDIVTLLLARRAGVGTAAVALRVSGTKLFTEVMGAQLDQAQLAEIGTAMAAWYGDAAIFQAIARCATDAGAAGDDDLQRRVRGAVERMLAGQERLVANQPIPLPKRIESSSILVAGLALSLAIVLWPGARRPWPSGAPRADDRRALFLVLIAAAAALAMAVVIARGLEPDGDEVETLASRRTPLAYIVSWRDGGEPFNPPGAAALFSLWLRLADGFLWGRVLAVALIPLTAWLAYRAGAGLAGPAAGVSFAAMLVLAPAYLRLAVIARPYVVLAAALCGLLAAIAQSGERSAGGRRVGIAAVVALWVSYLLWPLACAAPWLARLERRDRLRLTLALAVMVAAMAPRVVNGFGSAIGPADLAQFELHGPLDALGYALTMAGQAGTLDVRDSRDLHLPAAIVAAALCAAAVVGSWRAGRPLRLVAAILALLLVPVLALLARAVMGFAIATSSASRSG